MSVTHATVATLPDDPNAQVGTDEWNAAHVGNSIGWLNVLEYGAIGNGVADDTAAIQSAINALPVAGGLIYFPAGTYIISASLSVTVSKTIFDGTGSVLKAAAGLSGSPFITFRNVDYCQITQNIFFNGNWVSGVSAIYLIGSIAGLFNLRGDQLGYGVKCFATVAAGAGRNVAMNAFDIVIRNGINGMTFLGDGTYFASNNYINRISWWGVAATAGIGLDFQAYADNNITNNAFIDIENVGSTAVVYNSSSPAAEVGVYENHFQGILESSVGGTGLDGNRTDTAIGVRPTRFTARLGGSTPPTNSIQANSDVVTLLHTDNAFDATAPTTQAYGDAAATGSATVAARRDHKHGMPVAPRSARVTRTAGDLTLTANITTPTELSSTLRLTLAAVAGDRIMVGYSGIVAPGASSDGSFSSSTIVSGAVTNQMAAGSRPAGHSYLGSTAQSHSTILYTVVSGDISGGNVIVSPTYTNHHATNTGTAYAGTTYGLTYWAVNLGQ